MFFVSVSTYKQPRAESWGEKFGRPTLAALFYSDQAQLIHYPDPSIVYHSLYALAMIRHTAQFSLILFYTFTPDFSHKSLDLVSQLSYNIITGRDKEPIIKEETEMTKYNKSEIMKKAWELFRTFQRSVSPPSFGGCLSRAWHFAKANVARNERLNRVIENGESVNGCYVRKDNAADMGRIGYIITGKTYNFRKELKRFGFRFDGETKCWFTFDRNDAIRFVSAIA